MNEDHDNLEGPLTYEECKKGLDSFQNDKSPGVDGFTVEFYKFFNDFLGNDLLVFLSEAYEKQELFATKRHNYFTTKSRWHVTRFTQLETDNAAEC